MSDAGIYQLLIDVQSPIDLTIGALGQRALPTGWYVYTGSMKRGLSHRLRRHCAREKPLRWHIDYLTCAVGVAETRAWPLTSEHDQECATHQRFLALPGVSTPVPGFGSSDCRCSSHLACLGLSRDVWDGDER